MSYSLPKLRHRSFGCDRLDDRPLRSFIFIPSFLATTWTEVDLKKLKNEKLVPDAHQRSTDCTDASISPDGQVLRGKARPLLLIVITWSMSGSLNGYPAVQPFNSLA